MDALIVDHDQLSWLHIPLKLGADDVEGAAFGSDNPGFSQPAQGQGAQPLGIQGGYQLPFRKQQKGVSTLKQPQGILHLLFEGRELASADQVGHHFRIGGGLEDAALFFQLPAQLQTVEQVAAVAKGQAPCAGAKEEGLHVFVAGIASPNGVAHMADGRGALQFSHGLYGEDVRNQAFALLALQMCAIGDHNPCTFLSPVLQAVQGVVGQAGGLGMSPNSEHLALLL